LNNVLIQNHVCTLYMVYNITKSPPTILWTLDITAKEIYNK